MSACVRRGGWWRREAGEVVEGGCKSYLYNLSSKLNNQTLLLILILPALAPNQASFSQWREPLSTSPASPLLPGPKGSASVPTPSPTPTRSPSLSRLP